MHSGINVHDIHNIVCVMPACNAAANKAWIDIRDNLNSWPCTYFFSHSSLLWRKGKGYTLETAWWIVCGISGSHM